MDRAGGGAAALGSRDGAPAPARVAHAQVAGLGEGPPARRAAPLERAGEGALEAPHPRERRRAHRVPARADHGAAARAHAAAGDPHQLPPARRRGAVVVDPGSPWPEEQAVLRETLDKLARKAARRWASCSRTTTWITLGGATVLGLPIAATRETAERLDFAVRLPRRGRRALRGGPPRLARAAPARPHPRHLRRLRRAAARWSRRPAAGVGTVIVDPPEGDMKDYPASLDRLLGEKPGRPDQATAGGAGRSIQAGRNIARTAWNGRRWCWPRCNSPRPENAGRARAFGLSRGQPGLVPARRAQPCSRTCTSSSAKAARRRATDASALVRQLPGEVQRVDVGARLVGARKRVEPRRGDRG